jgi:hypothetical protein
VDERAACERVRNSGPDPDALRGLRDGAERHVAVPIEELDRVHAVEAGRFGADRELDVGARRPRGENQADAHGRALRTGHDTRDLPGRLPHESLLVINRTFD